MAAPVWVRGAEPLETIRDVWLHGHAHRNTVAGNEALVIDGASRHPSVSFFGLNPGLVKSTIRSQILGAGSFKHRLLEGLIGMLSGGPDDSAEETAPLVVSPGRSGGSDTRPRASGRFLVPAQHRGKRGRGWILRKR